MKTVRFLGNQQVAVVELPDPVPHDNHVVVKIMASTICGTERHAYEAGLAAWQAGVRENAGHESAGIVWKTGPAALVREGSRVLVFAALRHCGRCRYCLSGRWVLCQGPDQPVQSPGHHSQYVLVRDDFCLPLPDDVDFEDGALFTDALGTAFRAIKRMKVTAQDTVLITGQGPVGLAATMICEYLHAPVIAADINEYRLACARRCGAGAVVNPSKEDVVSRVRESVSPDGVDVAIDCSGTQDGRLACLEAVRRGGARVAFVGLGGGLQLTAEQASRVFLKEIELIGSWYSDPGDVLEIAQMVRRGLDPSRMVTHRFGIDEAQEAYTTCFGGAGGKVIVLPW